MFPTNIYIFFFRIISVHAHNKSLGPARAGSYPQCSAVLQSAIFVTPFWKLGADFSRLFTRYLFCVFMFGSVLACELIYYYDVVSKIVDGIL